MRLFKWLPTVNRFCGCTRNLKLASLIIIFLGLFASISTANILCDPICEELYTTSSPIKTLSNVLRWVLFSCELILIASLFAYLFGIFLSLPVTADILITSALVTCVITIIYCTVIIIHEQYTRCHWYHTQWHNFLLAPIMWGYFVLVINSYAEQMNSSLQSQ